MSVLRFSSVFMIFSVSAVFFIVPLAFAQSGEEFASEAIANAEGSIVLAYEAALKAEEVGGNVSGLFVRLNEAGEFLAVARMSFKNGDFDSAVRFADLSRNVGEEVEDEAAKLKDVALSEGVQRVRFTLFGSVSGIVLIGIGSFLVWRFLKRRYQ